MTGEKYVADCRGWLEMTAARGDISAEEAAAIRFVLTNWHKFEPANVGETMASIEAREIVNIIYNYLGLKKPDEVRKWIVDARAEILSHREGVK